MAQVANDRDPRRREFSPPPDGPYTCTENKSGYLYLWDNYTIPESCLVSITEATERISELEGTVSSLKEKFQTASGEATVLRRQLEDSKKGSSVMQLKLQLENNSSKKKITELQDQNEDLAAQVQSLQQKLERSKLKSEKRKQKLLSRTDAYRQKEQNAETEIATLRKDLKRCRKTLRVIRSQPSDLAVPVSGSSQNDHQPVTQNEMKELSAKVMKVYRKVQKRIAEGAQQKMDPYRCSMCTFKTGDVWKLFRHLRKVQQVG